MSEITRSSRAAFRSSLERCKRSLFFIPDFYRTFIAAEEEVGAMFRNTDFDVQGRMLLRSLELVADATDGQPAGLQELNQRAMTHNRHHLDISPRLYEIWLEAIVSSASVHDLQWNEEVEDAWRSILGFAISYMVRRH